MVMNHYLAVILVRNNIGICNACWCFRISSLLFGRPGSGHRDENNVDFACFLHEEFDTGRILVEISPLWKVS